MKLLLAITLVAVLDGAVAKWPRKVKERTGDDVPVDNWNPQQSKIDDGLLYYVVVLDSKSRNQQRKTDDVDVSKSLPKQRNIDVGPIVDEVPMVNSPSQSGNIKRPTDYDVAVTNPSSYQGNIKRPTDYDVVDVTNPRSEPRKIIIPIDEKPNDINSFSWKVFQGAKLSNPVGNLVLSPISIQFLLALMELAAEGETKRQLQLITGFKQVESLRSVLDDVVSRQASHLETAAAIFVTSNQPVNKTFAEKAKKTGTDVQHIGLNENPNEVINQWISKATHGKIRNAVNLLQGVNPEIVLTSAIHFQGKWLHKFTPSPSEGFYTFVGKADEAEYMQLTDNLLYEEFVLGKHAHGSVIGIPFDVPNSFLFVVLPGPDVTLDTFMRNVSPETFNRFYSNDGKQKEQIKLIMPKFQATSHISVVNSLLKMGLVDLFDRNSNLPYLVPNRELQITDIIQQSTLSVDEDGATAASVTSSYIVPLSASSDKQRSFRTVKVNKPFLAVIVDNGVPIFVSKIYKPNKI